MPSPGPVGRTHGTRIRIAIGALALGLLATSTGVLPSDRPVAALGATALAAAAFVGAEARLVVVVAGLAAADGFWAARDFATGFFAAVFLDARPSGAVVGFADMINLYWEWQSSSPRQYDAACLARKP